MASDEITWQILAHQHCSYKLKLDTRSQTFCRNEHNLTGFCNRQSCPLANSRYATIRSDPATGNISLYIKTPERCHLPSKWWERIALPANYEKALGVIDEKLRYWPKFYIHKCKQRLTRLTQVAIRERRIAKEEERLGEKIVPRLAPKVKRREATRERKAESAAKIERAIERELLERLRSGAYTDKPVNVEEGIYKKVLRALERDERGEELEEEEEEDDEREVEVEYVSDLEESGAEEMEDFVDWFEGDSDDDEESEVSGEDEGSDESTEEDSEEDEEADEKRKAAPGSKRKRPAPAAKPRKKGPKYEIEYETVLPQKEAELAF